MERLAVWFDDIQAAVLERADPEEDPTLSYTDGARARWGDGTPLLSVQLPVRGEPWSGKVVRRFLTGLLPEGQVAALLFQRAKLAENDVFGYLRAYGADCAGALSIVAADSPPPPGDQAGVEWLDEVRLKRLVADLPRAPLGLGLDGEVKLSLAGVQHKLALVRRGDGLLGLPLHGRASTHILKPEPYEADRAGLIAVEAFCLKLAEAVGLPTASSTVVPIAGKPALLLDRYDRIIEGSGHVRRVHQEDLCQAAGQSPDLKYEKQGGIGFGTAARILWEHSAQAFLDLANLLRLATVTVLVGNGDSHAKNISFLHTPVHALHLAPAYDIACSTVFIPGDTLGMQIGGTYRFEEIDADRLIEEARSWDLPPAASAPVVADVVAKAAEAVAPLLDRAHEENWYEPVLDDVADVVRRAVGRLSRRS
jgi:serine/threonine-protein kinase HipA